jgi:hypothetical protein
MFCFRNCDLSFKSSKVWTGEYFLADRGYALNSTTLTPYKMPVGDQNQFNYKISSARIIVEHVLGLLKGIWSSFIF